MGEGGTRFFERALIDWLIDMVDWLVDWWVDWLIGWLIDSVDLVDFIGVGLISVGFVDLVDGGLIRFD